MIERRQDADNCLHAKVARLEDKNSNANKCEKQSESESRKQDRNQDRPAANKMVALDQAYFVQYITQRVST